MLRGWWWLCLLGLGCATTDAVTVETPDGTLLGETRRGVSRFLGVPYAKPPVGERRFRPPEPIEPWTEGLAATVAQPRCTQLLIDRSAPLQGASENCLFLNVYAPDDAEGLPVMLFFPGGAYIFGGADEPMYEGSKLAREGRVVVVTANYRLGPFGFLAHPALRATNDDAAGNFGLLDQREAMRWVQRNIAAFGGDPSRVAIFGESAGAGSVCMHLLSPGSAGLFHRAIMQSAPCTAYPLPTRAEAELQAQTVSEALGCRGDAAEVAACLRSVDAEAMLRAAPLNTNVVFGEGVAWGPTVDDAVITAQPKVLFESGRVAPVPLIVGANADEGTLFFSKAKDFTTEAQLREAIGELFPPAIVDAAIARYGLSPSVSEVGIQMLSDVFVCDARRVARLHAATGQPVYAYHFARGFFDVILGLGAFHGAELPFLFDNSIRGLSVQPLGAKLRSSMQGYWSGFAATGDPNGADRPGWPRYDAQSDRLLKLDVPISEETKLRDDACSFWDGAVLQ